MMAIHNEAEIENVRVINFGNVKSLRREVSGYLGSPAGKKNMNKVYTQEAAIPLPRADLEAAADKELRYILANQLGGGTLGITVLLIGPESRNTRAFERYGLAYKRFAYS